MTEALGMSQGQDTTSLTGNVTSSAPTVSQDTAAPKEERSFKQSEVNALVGREKARAIEEYRRQANTQPEYIREKYGEPPLQTAQHTQSPNISTDEVRRLASEEAQRLRDEWVQEAKTRSETEYAKRIVQNFWDKTTPGKEKYQDFDSVTGDIEFAKFPNVVQILGEHLDNADDVLYEMGKDRGKLALLESLAERSPKDAIKQAQRLAQSIKDNNEASKSREAREPLSQMRPSNTGTDNSVMGVSDYRRKWKV